MIATLTPTPTRASTAPIDARRTARARRACSGPSSMTRAGRRQGRQHLASGGRRRACRRSRCSRPSTTTRSCVGLLRDGIDCRPITPTGAVRGQPHDHRARRHHHQDQQPGRRRRPPPHLDRAGRRAARAGRPGRVGGAGRLAAARRARRTGTPSWSRPCAGTSTGSPSTPRDAPAARARGRARRRGPRPDEAQRRGARLPHRQRPGGHRGRPGRRRAGRARCCVDARRRCGAGHPRWPRCRARRPREGAWHATPPPDHRRQHRRRRRLQPVRLPAGRPARRRRRPTGSRLAVAYGSAAAGLPGTTIPDPTHVRPEPRTRPSRPARPRTHRQQRPMTDHDRPHHTRARPARRRPRHRQGQT